MPTLKKHYEILATHYERCLEQYGPTPQGVDWPNATDLNTRFTVMTDLFIKNLTNHSITLLDLGCGYGAFLNFLKKSNFHHKIQYKGIDLSAKMIHAATLQHDHTYFETKDVLLDVLPINSFDYIIMNGLFTIKSELSQNDMLAFFTAIIETTFKAARFGIAFNVMNSHVDWFRDDLFHLPIDQMFSILKKYTKHLIIRADYGLYEYTVYAYKTPNQSLY